MILQFFKFYHAFLILLIAVTVSSCASGKPLDVSDGVSTSYTINLSHTYRSVQAGPTKSMDTGIWIIGVNGNSYGHEGLTPSALGYSIEKGDIPKTSSITLDALKTNTLRIVFSRGYRTAFGGGRVYIIRVYMDVTIKPLKEYDEAFEIGNINRCALHMDVDQSQKKIFCKLFVYKGPFPSTYIVGSSDYE